MFNLYYINLRVQYKIFLESDSETYLNILIIIINVMMPQTSDHHANLQHHADY